MTDDTRVITRARVVAEYWRDEAMKDSQAPIFWGAVAHACAMVLAALDGETDPVHMGTPPDEFERRLAAIEEKK